MSDWQPIAFILGMLAFAATAGALGCILGVAYGIETERKYPRKPPPPPLKIVETQ